jgi:hypothetical protein
MNADRFDLEQEIMKCWNVVEDIKLLTQTMDRRELSEDEMANYLIGLETIYTARFENLFAMFEQLIQEKKIL